MRSTDICQNRRFSKSFETRCVTSVGSTESNDTIPGFWGLLVEELGPPEGRGWSPATRCLQTGLEPLILHARWHSTTQNDGRDLTCKILVLYPQSDFVITVLLMTLGFMNSLPIFVSARRSSSPLRYILNFAVLGQTGAVEFEFRGPPGRSGS